MGQAFARASSAEVLICHWHSIDFTDEAVTAQGPVYRVTPGRALVAMTIDKALAIDAMFFYGPYCGVLTPRDGHALQRLICAGIDVAGVPLHFVVDRMMLAASSRGIATNALGWARNWGAKDQQEFKLRRYEQATGHIVNRPETHVAHPHELRAVLAAFAKRGEVCLLKPVLGEGGRDFRVVRPGRTYTERLGSSVVPRVPRRGLLPGDRGGDARLLDGAHRDHSPARASSRLTLRTRPATADLTTQEFAEAWRR